MRTLLLAMLPGLLGLGLLGPAGCSKRADEAAPAAASAPTRKAIAALSVDELEAKLQRGECRAVDANGDVARKRLGMIPGAVLLSDYETFLPSELPADRSKGLVFYCTNEHCGASEEAAARAITAGYTDVKVLPAGIVGWAKAGKQIAKL
jgi:rhodanese-related sulfurtransferase